jgi:undecaprenyl-diphosphatase
MVPAVGPDPVRHRRSAPRALNLRSRRAAAAVALALAAFVPICWAVIALLGAFPGDAGSAAEVREERHSGLALAIAHALDWLGHPGVAAGVSAALALGVWRAYGRRHAALVLAALGVSIITTVLKVSFGRTRPPGALPTDPSFPSGHTAWATAVFGLVALLAAADRRWGVTVVCALIIACMGPSRVLLGVHWFSDVIAGYAIGLAWLLVVVLVGLPWAQQDRAARAGEPARS